jgi:hypothetical protein
MTYTFERRIWPTQLGGQQWGTRDCSFRLGRYHSLTPCALVCMSYDIRDPRRRIIDDSTRPRVRLPYGTSPIPGEFYRDYIAAWLGPILEFTFAQQRCANACITAQYGLTRQKVEGVPELDWLRTLLARGCPQTHSHTWSNTRMPRNSSSSFSDAPLTTTSSNSEPFNLMRPLRGSTNCCENGIWLNCRTMRNLLRRSPNHSNLFGLMITHLRRGDTPSRIRLLTSKDVHTISGMPGIQSSIVYTSRATLVMVSIILD